MIDLHTHTNHSDGSSTVEELLKKAEELHLTTLSITDHNTIAAYQELKNPFTRTIFNGRIITGVEITTTYKGETIEVLGYNFNLTKMQEFLDSNVLTFEEKQLKEYELIKNKYKKIGVIFNEENISFNPKIESSRTAFVNEIKKYDENKKFFLYEESYETDPGFTRNEVYNPKSPLYVDESSLFPSLEKTINMIHESNGLAFLAHTYAYSSNIAKELANIITTYDLDGLECYYTTFTDEQTTYLLKLCNERNMYISGGSDYHGNRKKNHNLATGHGNLNIPETIITPWLKERTDKFD